MKTVKEIYNFFLDSMNSERHRASLMDFLETVPEFKKKQDDGCSKMNMSLGMEYLKICEQMCNDFLLIKVKNAGAILIDAEYIAVSQTNSTNPKVFIDEIEYGKYDFKYRGFPHIRNHFFYSVLPIVGKNRKTGDEDLGTCFYIGNNMFVTAAHCVKGLENFNILMPNNSPLQLSEVWYAKEMSLDDYDLAIIRCTEVPKTLRAFKMKNPCVLDEVMTMGYPPIPGLNPVLISETASVASYVNGRQKATTGQVVAEVGSYMSTLDFFVITARVKGGNSGSPVINRDGYVVGTVFQIPFDSQGGADGGRYDIMGYGICLPSKYIMDLINQHESHNLNQTNGAYNE